MQMREILLTKWLLVVYGAVDIEKCGREVFLGMSGLCVLSYPTDRWYWDSHLHPYNLASSPSFQFPRTVL